MAMGTLRGADRGLTRVHRARLAPDPDAVRRAGSRCHAEHASVTRRADAAHVVSGVARAERCPRRSFTSTRQCASRPCRAAHPCTRAHLRAHARAG